MRDSGELTTQNLIIIIPTNTAIAPRIFILTRLQRCLSHVRQPAQHRACAVGAAAGSAQQKSARKLCSGYISFFLQAHTNEVRDAIPLLHHLLHNFYGISKVFPKSAGKGAFKVRACTEIPLTAILTSAAAKHDFRRELFGRQQIPRRTKLTTCCGRSSSNFRAQNRTMRGQRLCGECA